jgi:hypothetical protein
MSAKMSPQRDPFRSPGISVDPVQTPEVLGRRTGFFTFTETMPSLMLVYNSVESRALPYHAN